jgi:hypothetical protein
MSDGPACHDFAYVETDIPPGMTICEWRAQRAAESAAQREAEREARRRRSRTRTVFAALGARWRANGRRLVWRTEVRHSSGTHGRIST